MDALLPELTRRSDGAKLVGYLNFSDGRPDPKFRGGLAEAWAVLLDLLDPAPWRTLPRWLDRRADELQASGSAAYADVAQAKAVIAAGLVDLPAAYKAFHADLLAHQTDAGLFGPFFLARCAEAALAARSAQKPARAALAALNDFVGYRPIALLETRPQTEFDPHEKVCPVPLFFRGVGTAPGRYADIVRPTLELLANTDPDRLAAASFELGRMDELAVDPRAVDHFHPVNKRPSVLFGEWDPHRIDNQGFYRRFVLRQPTLDALLAWATDGERRFEAAAALCGTILMGAGVSGSGPTDHDSTVTLGGLVQRIARYRDDFYKHLLTQVPGPHGERLRDEAQRLKQPFAGVRQYLNATIAGERALHLQERRLALLFASMGYPTAARERAGRIPAPAARFAAEVRIRQTEAGHAVSAGKLPDARRLLDEAEDLLRRGIACGALIDPWNVLGYQGLFPIFPGRDDTVRDPRAEDLILTVGRQLDLYAQGLTAAASGPDRAAEAGFRDGMAELAGWWDKYATTAVSDLPKVSGQERAEAADHVAKAMALWQTGGAQDPAFWRKHRDGFKTPAAFAQVIDALLGHGDHKAALALLVTWLSEADRVPLQDPAASFVRLAFRWLRAVSAPAAGDPADRRALVARFFELLEVNADDRWQVPHLGLGPPPREPGEDADDEDEDDDPFASAYEGVTFKDSADDGEEGSVAEGGGPAPGEFALDGDGEAAEERLRFLAAVARLWRTAARPDLWAADPAPVGEWLRAARQNLSDLRHLADRLADIEVPEPTAGLEGVMEYDRRRSLKGHLLDQVVQTAAETAAAARALAAAVPKAAELPGPQPAMGPTADLPPWEPAAVRLERAVAAADPAAARKAVPGFVHAFRHEPLLVSPPADGGRPAPAMRAQTALQMVESLLARLPRLGLLRETFQLTKLARAMERNDPPDGRRVSSFDQLFRTAATGVFDALLSAGRDAAEDAAEDGPLATALRTASEAFHQVWVDHSGGLRLSALEAVLDADDWAEVRDFVRTYGGDLFSVRFLTLSNVRGILGQGVANWLDRQAAEGDDPRPKLVEAWDAGRLDRTKTARLFEVVLQSLVEHYDEYRDYNTTTTQSDYGENLYTLLDFLRLKVQYDRLAWRLRPLVLAHDALCRRGFDRLAEKWREFVGNKTGKPANDLLAELAAREAEHAVRLRTIRDRLEERFVQPLRMDQAAARVARAAQAAKDGQAEDNPSFQGLLAAIRPLADHPSGVGLDVPAWLRRVEDELRKVRATPDGEGEPAEAYPFPEAVPLDFDQLKRQLAEWDKPLGE
jgi:hypothetical protein